MNSVEPQAPVWLSYSLVGGFVHDWLMAGPLASSVPNLDDFPGADFKLQIARSRYRTETGLSAAPAELQKFAPFGGETELTWQVYRAEDDHFVDRSLFYHTCHHLHTWAFGGVESPVAQNANAVLTTNGPADVWLNGQHIHRVEHFHHQSPGHSACLLPLQEGRNELLVRFEGVAVRECPYVMALRLDGEGLSVALPTTVQPVARRQKLEALFATAYLTQDIFTREQEIVVHWPDGNPAVDNIALRLQRKDGRIYSEHHTEGTPKQKQNLGVAYQFPPGEYEIVLFPHPADYYEKGMRVERRLPLRIVGNHKYSSERYGSYPERREEALKAAARRGVNVFSEIAKMELGWFDLVEQKPIHETIGMINSRADCSDFYLVGLLGMVGRYIESPGFPQELVAPLQECFLNFRYWMDEPGSDAMCFWSENHQILFHACAVLAGQLLPDEIFTNAGMTGEEHREKGERMALSWLRKRANGGFREWDSNTYFEEDVLALSHLADLAENDEVRELATVVLDKLLFNLAVNSYKGVFGSTHGRSYAPYLKGGFLEPTSGISRLLWGKGIFNERILGVVSLACAVSYLLPPVIEAIALDPAEEIWSRERHSGTLERWCDLAEGDWTINKVTYKTPDYMLASAQDWQAGHPGYQQHIWQATLSPEAVVFVTHPPCLSEDGSHRPNFWHGNVVLPRTAQWKDVLISLHKLPADDWLGFTHAYFPTYAFDEWALEGGWAFARVGEGYLAISASQGIELTKQGKSAFQELRSYGSENAWLVQMGRAANDGTFADFQAKVLGLDVRLCGLSVQADTLRGESIDFAWEGPLLVNERAQPISGFAHYDSPYAQMALGDEKMELQFQDLLVRLDFS
ncbi:MAG: hypothetical protein DWI57_01195 [Chloroflexi bacterium]|nr:MAG: hypothetical protein DWI57_01195 [Chloroflexota bacterium]